MRAEESQNRGGEVVARFPCSGAQRQFWFLDQFNPGDPSLNVAMRWEIEGRLQDGNIERALQAAVERHEILRTRFAEVDGEPEQEVLARVEFRPSLIDLRTTPAAERPARIEEIIEAEAARPFDLSRACQLRAVAIRGAADRVTILVVAHHAIFDGLSIAVLARDFARFAEAFELGRSAEADELPLQYGDFAMWQAEMLASGVAAEDRAYWARQMQGAEHFELEPDKPRPAKRSHAVARIHGDLPDGFDARFEAAVERAGSSAFVFGAAVVGASLARAAGRREVVFSLPVSDRPDPDLEQLVGPFIVTQALRFPAEPEASFGAHLAGVRTAVEGGLAHRNLEFSTLVEIVNPPRDPSRAPITSVALNFMPVFSDTLDQGAFRLTPAPAFNPGAVQDLHIHFMRRAAGWRMTIEYCPDLYESSTIEGLIATITQGFEAVFADPETRLGALPLAPALARRGETESRGLKRVEQVLAAHPEVGAAAAVAAGAQAYGFVSPREGSLMPLEQLPAALMAHAAAELPEEARPSGVSVLAALPRTASGDIDRARLPVPPEPTAVPVAKAAAAVQSREEIEATLETLWKELLDLPQVPHGASFFDLGGHSLLAVRMIARLRATFRVGLGVASLYAQPTILGLAGLIRAELAPAAGAIAAPVPEDDWRIEPLQSGGTGAPIIAVNDVGIMVSALGHMRERHQATCVRLFDGSRGIDQTPRSFEEIAAEYAKVVRRVQPEGPYVFFGICVHGNIALETARILQAEGAEISAVIIKDVWEPGYAARLKGDSYRRWLERFAALRTKIRAVRRGRMTVSAMLGSYRIVRKTGLLQLARAMGLIDRVRWTDMTPEQEGFVAYISAARNQYRPAPFNAPVLHVVTGITPRGRAFAPSIGWEDVVTGPLKTVYIEDLAVSRGREFGTRDLAREIETFLAEQA
ncbi:condensation domain-containing protein [Solirhodobacter olei]|uniref:condensation domain-containing protein n=1 Tax=Solirhodobacter olei TaxID=2493082 RepID=UPI000FDB8CCB|nr:condensation domain-containing protein [Solirhodobacter olei]